MTSRYLQHEKIARAVFRWERQSFGAYNSSSLRALATDQVNIFDQDIKKAVPPKKRNG